MAMPKVLHIGNTANLAAELRDGLAELRAAECLVLEPGNNRLQFAEDARFTWDWISSSVRRLERHLAYVLLLKSLLDEADLLHLHTTGRVAFACQRWFRAKGKPVVLHFHGEELRLGVSSMRCETRMQSPWRPPTSSGTCRRTRLPKRRPGF